MVPKPYYNQLRDMQEKLYQQQQRRVPLWECTKHLTLEQERWRDDLWFTPKNNRKGNLFDMFSILFLIAVGLLIVVMGVLFINGLNDSIQASNIPSHGKQFMGTFQSQNSWVLDFLFLMLLISFPMVSAILAYFNNIPPFLFWGGIGLVMLVVVFANVIGDAYVNLAGVNASISTELPMTDFVMRHFVAYAMLSCIIIMFGVFVKPKNVGYAP